MCHQKGGGEAGREGRPNSIFQKMLHGAKSQHQELWELPKAVVSIYTTGLRRVPQFTIRGSNPFCPVLFGHNSALFIKPGIKILRFNHFFRPSFPYKAPVSHKTCVQHVCVLLSCSSVFCSRRSWESQRVKEKRYLSFPSLQNNRAGFLVWHTHRSCTFRPDRRWDKNVTRAISVRDQENCKKVRWQNHGVDFNLTQTWKMGQTSSFILQREGS